MIIGLIDEAVTSGARQSKACEELGLDESTIQRWRRQDVGDDERAGPLTPPKNKLSDAEEGEILDAVNSPRFRNLSPRQIVPLLADDERYLASEPTIYRLLARKGQLAHRSASRPPQKRSRPRERVATAPRQVWSWDITWLKRRLLRGGHYKLYLILDIFSRKLVGWCVEEVESSELAAELMERVCREEGIARHRLVLHSDNGSPMRGTTLLGKLEELGIAPSFSRPRVSDDNAYSESVFGTLKACPSFPVAGFDDLEQARAWVATFVAWYNETHLHSGIRYVTPAARHRGDDRQTLAKRAKVYEAARKLRPDRWTRGTRNWSPIEEVRLNQAPPAEVTNSSRR